MLNKLNGNNSNWLPMNVRYVTAEQFNWKFLDVQSSESTHYSNEFHITSTQINQFQNYNVSVHSFMHLSGHTSDSTKACLSSYE